MRYIYGMSNSTATVTGKKIARLVCVDGMDVNRNKYYNMEDNGDGTFTAKWGRVGGHESSQTYPMDKWDSTIRSKTREGRGSGAYKDVTHLHLVKVEDPKAKASGSDVDAARPAAVRDMVTRLLRYANKSIDANYTVSAHSVTQAQVDEAQRLLDFIAKGSFSASTAKAVNARLMEFFAVVPRKMGKVADHLLPMDGTATRKQFDEIVTNEQNTLDVMAGQVALDTQQAPATAAAPSKDALDAIGLSMVLVTDAAEIRKIKAAMQSKHGMFKQAFKVVNAKTAAAYDKQMKTATNKREELFWHGSRSENWWNILGKGLLIRPTGASYQGSMFGDGIYFAPEFDKSLGYTSIASSRWAGGSSKNAFLALYKVHVGKAHVTLHSDSSLSLPRLKALGCDSTHGKKGPSLYRDEHIVYQPCQCTVDYLVEVEGSQY